MLLLPGFDWSKLLELIWPTSRPSSPACPMFAAVSHVPTFAPMALRPIPPHRRARPCRSSAEVLEGLTKATIARGLWLDRGFFL